MEDGFWGEGQRKTRARTPKLALLRHGFPTFEESKGPIRSEEPYRKVLIKMK
jgi:hypothetical protein